MNVLKSSDKLTNYGETVSFIFFNQLLGGFIGNPFDFLRL